MFSKGFSYSDWILRYLKQNVSCHLLTVVGKSLVQYVTVLEFE